MPAKHIFMILAVSLVLTVGLDYILNGGRYTATILQAINNML